MSLRKHAHATLALTAALSVASPVAHAFVLTTYTFYEVAGGAPKVGGVQGTLALQLESNGWWGYDSNGFGGNIQSFTITGGTHYPPFTTPRVLTFSGAGGGSGIPDSVSTSPGFPYSIVAGSSNPFTGVNYGAQGTGELYASDQDDPPVPTGYTEFESYTYGVVLGASTLREDLDWVLCTGQDSSGPTGCTVNEGSAQGPTSISHDIVWVAGNAPAVPVPAALPLFLSALASLGAIRWRRKV